jgi:hypothetical protein
MRSDKKIKMKWLWNWTTLAFLMTIVSCGAPAPGPGPGTSCSPGQTMSCACSNGSSGTTTCSSFGTYGACVGCPGPGCTPSCSGRNCGDNGCGGSCGTCAGGMTCNGGTCAVDPGSFWVLTVTNGTVTERNPGGSSWDAVGGAPDPMVCLTINGERRCTQARADTFSPSWNAAFPATTAGMLQAGFTAEYLDEDVTTNDVICGRGIIPLRPGDFSSRSGNFGCDSGRVNFTLSPM